MIVSFQWLVVLLKCLIVVAVSVVECGSGDMWDLGENVQSGSGAFNNTTAFDYEDNLTLTCVARSIQGPIMLPYSPLLVGIVRVIQCVLFFLVLIAGLFLNIQVIVLVVKYKKLRNYSFGITLQVVALNLLLLFTYMTVLVSGITNRWVFGEKMCVIFGVLMLVAGLARTLLMCVFVIDRFLTVFVPFVYPKFQLKVTVILSVFSWLFCIAASIVPLPWILDCYCFNSYSLLCGLSTDCSRYCSFFVCMLLSSVTGPVIFLSVILYTMLYMKAKLAKLGTVVPSVSESVAIPMEGHRDRKATITFFLLFLSLFIVTFPITVLTIINGLFFDSTPYHPLHFIVSIACRMLFSLLPITDPIVILRNRDAREICGELKQRLMQKLCPSCVKSENEQATN